MRLEQQIWAAGQWPAESPSLGGSADLIVVFGGRAQLAESTALVELRERYPDAKIFGCSTAGEIAGTAVADDTVVATAIEFEHTSVRGAAATIESAADSRCVGEEIARKLTSPDLTHVFVLSNGLAVNGSELVRGFLAGLPERVTVTGGLSGDGDRFRETLTLCNGEPRNDMVAAIGFYGDRINVGYGSLGGWDSFGPQRLITRAEGSVLFELDGKPALELYKRYLGSHADELPASGLLFPLSITVCDEHEPVVRTILAVDEERGSMTFAGDIPEGAVARLMKANFDRLIDGAAGAARASVRPLRASGAELAILISCVGRKLVLKQRVEEEVEAVQEVVGAGTMLTGFYSYGEISPFVPEARCELHNQTMTITTFSETA